ALHKLKIPKHPPYNKLHQPQTNQQLSHPKTHPIHTITNIQPNLPKKTSPPLELHSNFHHLNPQINPTPNPTQQQKQHPIQTLNPKTHQVNNLI
ncbi:hypothetical protein, partial [Staphylococcus epidermidis]|uniref:hypothetical protein n=1 Tax=Staphylococcus epidermidis TaxID=1282 RepID=UPI001C9331CB